MLMLILSATANSLLIEPLDDINLVAGDGFETVIFTIINDENMSIDIYINTTPSLDNIVFLDDELTVSANSTVNVSCVILKNEPATGQIIFDYNSTTLEVNVVIEENETTTENESITIIPSQPTSESNIVFILPNREDATGYVICSETNKVYIIDVTDGIGFVELDGDDYGEAHVAIFSKQKTYVAEFTITAHFQESLTIDMPSTTVIHTMTTFQVLASGVPIQAKINFKLDQLLISKTTDEQGVLSLEFNEVGNWTVTAKVFNVEETRNIYVAQKPISITLPENIYVDEEMDVIVGKKSEVLISFNELSWSYSTDDTGKFVFTPSSPGKHNLHVVAEDLQEASKDFIVHADTFITVKNKERVVTSVKPHTLYAIYVLDENDRPVESKLEIYGDGELIDEIDIAGSAVWDSGKFSVNYKFEVSPSETGYVESLLILNGREDTLNMELIMQWSIIVIIAAILIMIYLFKREWFFSVHQKYRNRVAKAHKPKIPI